ncbi:MAG: PDZ domain-containing protein [Chlorobiales bacterium]|nr:PDZ domain-containing protein [Chlorobiales bacterium]
MTKVSPYGTAFARGIEENDFILEINQNKVSSTNDFEHALSSIKAGQAALLKIRKPFNKTPMFVAVEIPKR